MEKIILRFLGDYVVEFGQEQIKLGIWKGSIDIKNIQLNNLIIEQLKLPYRMVFSQIQEFQMSIPWQKLNSKQVEVNLKGLYVVLSPL